LFDPPRHFTLRWLYIL